MSGWGCPHEVAGKCRRVNNLPCNPGMKGCVLFGRFIWADESKNRPAAGWGSKESERQPEEDGLVKRGQEDQFSTASKRPH